MKALDIIMYIAMMLGGLGVFFYGLETLSNNLETLGGNKLRKLFDKFGQNKFQGLLLGTGATAVIQSSTAVTVTMVGFVNAGYMTLAQTVPIIMGANIGTTIDALFMALPIPELLSLLSFIGMIIVMVTKKDPWQKLGFVIAGLGLIFVGLTLMSTAMSPFQAQFGAFFAATSNPIILILLGAVSAAILHSSSAATGILIALAGANAGVDIVIAIYVILGVNIGTCFTALLAAANTSANGKRTAFIHFLFNFVGGFFMFILMLIPIVRRGILAGFSYIGSLKMQIAIFHMAFNIITASIMLPLSDLFVKVSCWIIKDSKKQSSEKFKLGFLNDLVLSSPALAVAHTKKEILRMAELAKTNYLMAMDMLSTMDFSHKSRFDEQEQELNFLNRTITSYLIQISGLELSRKDQKTLGSYYHVVSDIERIGDYAENITEYAMVQDKGEALFSDDAKKEIARMHESVKELYQSAIDAFTKADRKLLASVNSIESIVDNYKQTFTDSHIERLSLGSCSVDSGALFFSLVSDLERIADHMTNISNSIKDYA